MRVLLSKNPLVDAAGFFASAFSHERFICKLRA